MHNNGSILESSDLRADWRILAALAIALGTLALAVFVCFRRLSIEIEGLSQNQIAIVKSLLAFVPNLTSDCSQQYPAPATATLGVRLSEPIAASGVPGGVLVFHSQSDSDSESDSSSGWDMPSPGGRNVRSVKPRRRQRLCVRAAGSLPPRPRAQRIG